MSASRVYLVDLEASARENLLDKLVRTLDHIGLPEMLFPGCLVAVKLHFGESGNTTFIRPVIVGHLVRRLKALRAQPFLTDTNTLYSGSRANAASHIQTAIQHGFAYSVSGAPIVIADGLRGSSFSALPAGGPSIQTAYLAREIVEADTLVSLAHFKGHELCGFGGTLKNLGMGCAARKGKLEQHSGLAPRIKRRRCTGCGRCVRGCAREALSLRQGKAHMHRERCIGCGECIVACEQRAIQVRWSKDIPLLQKKMVEYAAAVVRSKQHRAVFLNFLTDITPTCDCHGFSASPVAPDMGVLVATDPVAIDQAAVDLVNQGSKTRAERAPPAGDTFRELYPEVDWEVQLVHAERIGLGRRDYELWLV